MHAEDGEKGLLSGLGKALKQAVGQTEDDVADTRRERGRSSVLMNDARRNLLSFLSRRPCSHMRSISRSLGWSMPTVEWHLKKLIKAGFVEDKRFGKRRVFYLTGHIRMEDIAACAHICATMPRRIMKHLSISPGMTQKELVEHFANTGIGKHLKDLGALGLVMAVNDGRFKRYYVDTSVKDMDKAYARRTQAIKKDLIKRLRKDGLDPQVLHSRDGILEIEISVGPKKKLLILNLIPFSSIISS